MNWIEAHWQTVAALAVVVSTAGLLLRSLRKKRGGKRCGACDSCRDAK